MFRGNVDTHYFVTHCKELLKQDHKFSPLEYNPPHENLKNTCKFYLHDNVDYHISDINDCFAEHVKSKEIHPRIVKLLKYGPGSYASIHTDNNFKGMPIIWTSITMLDQSKNNIGGNLILGDKEQYLETGDTVWYPVAFPHGVTKLYQGHRNVLVILWTSIYLTE
mgnify:CR=1 FL=1|jgi:hypothetical protein